MRHWSFPTPLPFSRWVGVSMVIGTLGIFVSIALTGRRLLAIGSPLLAPTPPSIPSRQVRDLGGSGSRLSNGLVEIVASRSETWEGRRLSPVPCPVSLATKFPSPQGGSETVPRPPTPVPKRKFPSPQGGSETSRSHASFARSSSCFHPLKAGRRPISPRLLAYEAPVSIPSRRVGDVPSPLCLLRYNLVSIPSRRVGDPPLVAANLQGELSFHPLKAGRRPCSIGAGCGGQTWFPSPQGGSETPSWKN